MRVSVPFTNRSLLLVLTSAMAACGGESGVGKSQSTGPEGPDAAVENTGGSSGAGGAEAMATGGVSGTGGIQNTGGVSGTGGVMADAAADAVADASCPPGMERVGDQCRYITIRRPFLVGASMRSADSVMRADWTHELAAVPHGTIDEPTRARLAAMWLKDGLEEHASVAAFARFTLHLLSLRAPPDLILRSQQASLDELRHAKACFALASRYGREACGPSGLRVDDAIRNLSLAEVARLTAEEGCVGETLGAILAREQLSVARDPAVITTLRKITADEARHAELAWRFVRWAVLHGGRAVEQAIVDGIERAIAATLAMEVVSYSGVDVDALHAHGRLTCEEARAVAKRGVEEVVRPCLRALGRSPMWTPSAGSRQLEPRFV